MKQSEVCGHLEQCFKPSGQSSKCCLTLSKYKHSMPSLFLGMWLLLGMTQMSILSPEKMLCSILEISYKNVCLKNIFLQHMPTSQHGINAKFLGKKKYSKYRGEEGIRARNC